MLSLRLDSVAWAAAPRAAYRPRVTFFDFDPALGQRRAGAQASLALTAQYSVDADPALIRELATGGVLVELVDDHDAVLGAATVAFDALLVRADAEDALARVLDSGSSPRATGSVSLKDGGGRGVASVQYAMRTLYPLLVCEEARGE
jgi:hypothetical protein